MEHDTDSLDCACGPEFFLPCDDHGDGETCWKCVARRGLVPITREEAEATERSVVIVHAESFPPPRGTR
jgi:hypothetical protein